MKLGPIFVIGGFVVVVIAGFVVTFWEVVDRWIKRWRRGEWDD